jgi:hypothetical protein
MPCVPNSVSSINVLVSDLQFYLDVGGATWTWTTDLFLISSGRA